MEFAALSQLAMATRLGRYILNESSLNDTERNINWVPPRREIRKIWWWRGTHLAPIPKWHRPYKIASNIAIVCITWYLLFEAELPDPKKVGGMEDDAVRRLRKWKAKRAKQLREAFDELFDD